MSDETIKEFCKELGTNPQKLGEFIKDPESQLSDFTEEEKNKIKAIVSHQVHTKLSEHNKPEEYLFLM